MVKDFDYINEEKYDDIIISDPAKASKILRQQYFNAIPAKASEILRQQYSKATPANDLYAELDREKKKIVNHVITCLVPEEKREQNIGKYLEELLTYREVSYTDIANRIDGKLQCDQHHGVDKNYFWGMGLEDIKSRLQSLMKVMKPQERSSELLEEICRLLNVDADVLMTGIGTEYSVDYEELDSVLNARQENIYTFMGRFKKNYFKCYGCSEDRNCGFKENYVKYKESDERGIAETFSKMLNIGLDEILIEREIIIELENFPFEIQYKKLSREKKQAVDQMIKGLYMLEYKENPTENRLD